MARRELMSIRKKRTRLRLLFVVTLLLFGLPARAGWEVGALLLLAGGLLHALAAGYLTKRRELAVAGPYRFVRNPFYVADFVRDAGVLLACHWRFTYGAFAVWWVAAIYFVVMYGLLIRPRVREKEEPALAGRFGEAYERYRREVPRFLPHPWPARRRGEGGFSWAELHRNRELPRLLGTLVLIPLTYYRWEAFHHDFRWARILDDHGEVGLLVAIPILILLARIPRIRAGRA